MEGKLDQVAVPQILQDLHRSGHSGIVHLSSGGVRKRVYFREGAIVFASSDAFDERLGERLVKSGALKRSDLELACRVTESSKLRLGATLVDMGYLTRESLDASLREQVTSIIYSLFPWDAGEFRTELVRDPVDADLERRDLSTANILMEGVRRLNGSRAVLRGLGDLEGPLSFAVDPAEVPDLKLTPEEGFVLSRVDSIMSPSEIAQISPLGEDETLRCIYALIAAGVLRLMPADPTSRRVPQETIATTEMPAEGESRSAPILRSDRPSLRTLELESYLSDKLARAQDLTLYELLEIPPNAVPEAIKAGYLRLVKMLHPDHRVGMKVDDPDGVFDALYLRVKDAYELLSNEAERRRYDFNLQQQAERRARSQELASAEPKPSDVQRKPKPKKEPRPERGFSAAESARIHYANGERYFAEGSFHEAIEELRTAVRIDPSRAEYHRLLGRALAKNPKWRKQAEEHFARALEINRFDAESYLALGEMYEASGLDTRARKMFEEALGVDPGNARALEKLADRRGSSTTMDKLKGILHRGRGH